MSARDLEKVLREASRSPLGPLTAGYSPLGADAWLITATWVGAPPVEIHAFYESSPDAVRLEWTTAAAVAAENLGPLIASRPWIMDAVPLAGDRVAVRLWLYVAGLSMNTWFAALAEAARFASILGRPKGLPYDGAVLPFDRAAVAATAPAPVLHSETIKQPAAASASPTPLAVAQPMESIEDAPRPPSWQTLAAVDGPTAPTQTEHGQQNGATSIREAVAEQSELVEANRSTGAAPNGGSIAAEPNGSTAEITAPPPGTPTAAEGATPVRAAGNCRECGFPYRPDHTFCVNCGARIN